MKNKTPKIDHVMTAFEQRYMHNDSATITAERSLRLTKLQTIGAQITRLSAQLEDARRDKRQTESEITGMTKALERRT